MRTDRVYQPARSEEDAVDELRAHSGTQFDGEVVTAFFQCLKRFSTATVAET